MKFLRYLFGMIRRRLKQLFCRHWNEGYHFSSDEITHSFCVDCKRCLARLSVTGVRRGCERDHGLLLEKSAENLKQ